MIGKLTGLVDSVGDDSVLIDVGGVGYIVACPATTLSRLTVGDRVSLLIEMKVSEDAMRLYGFLSSDEREWFRLLQSVQGVGAKVALAILTVLTPADLNRALAVGDKAMVGRAQGVGPKLALRIVTELKGKGPKLTVAALAGLEHAHNPVAATQGAHMDAAAALQKLGYTEAAAAEAVARAAQELGEGAPLDALIRGALKGMGK